MRPLVLHSCVCPAGCGCGGYGRRGAFGLAVPLEIGLGDWSVSRVGAFVQLDAAAAASPPVRVWVGCAAWVCAGRLGCVSRGCVYPTGCCCGGFAAGAHLGWLCRLGVDWALRLCLAWVRLSNWMRLRRLCRPCAFGLAVPLGIGLSAWHAPRVGALVRSGAAAAAMPPGRIWVGCAAWDWAGCLAIVSRGHV